MTRKGYVNLIRRWHWFWLKSDRKNWMFKFECLKMIHLMIYRSHSRTGWQHKLRLP